MADIQSQIATARKAGYDDAAITAHLSGMPEYGAKMKTALGAGYTPSEILLHLAPAKAEMASGVPNEFGGSAPTAPKEAPSFMDRVMGVYETPFALGANAVMGAIAPIAGAGAALFSGDYGTQKGVQAGEDVARKVMAMGYTPRTQTARDILSTVGDAANASGIQALAPMLTAPMGVRAASTAAEAGARAAVKPAQNALAQRAASTLEKNIANSVATAPMIEATQAAAKNGIAVNPVVGNPTVGNRLKAALTGSADTNATIAKANEPQWAVKAVEAMGLPPGTQLTKPSVYAAARALPDVAGPYETVANIPVVNVPRATYEALDNLRSEPLYGGRAAAAAANSFIDEITADLQGGGTGSKLLKSIQELRTQAQNTYRAGKAGHPLTPETRARANAQMGAADALELAIEESVGDPNARQAFRDARVKMKQTYDYESATNFGTGKIDPQVLARKLNEGEPLSGTVRELALIAANHPETSVLGANSGHKPVLTRSGVGAGIGAAIGGMLVPGAGIIPGSIIGGSVGAISSGLGAKRMLKPAYQAKNAVPTDYRPPTQIPRSNALVPYNAPAPEVLPPEVRPNFTFAPSVREPDIQPAMPNSNNLLEAPSSESTLGMLRNQDAWRGQQDHFLGQAAERAAAEAAAAARQPTGRGAPLVFDERGRLVPEATVGGNIPIPTALESAVQKMGGSMSFGTRSQYERVRVGTDAKGAPVYETRSVPLTLTPAEAKRHALPTRESAAFNMTAAEKVAWNKAKAGMADVMPEMGRLSDAEIVAKMNDRQWAATAVADARAKVEALANQERLVLEQLANRDNLKMLGAEITAKQKELANIRAHRASLADLADHLDKTMQAPRATSAGKAQGPMTRAAIRQNNLASEQNQNALAR